MRKVAIMGTAPSTRGLVNELDETWEIWGLNTAHHYLRRPADRWFQIHPAKRPDRPGMFGRGEDHLDWLQTCGIPVYMDREYEEIPTSVEYSVRAVDGYFGEIYLTSTLAYMLCMAIMEGVDMIMLAGCDLSANTEYYSQRPCVEYWIGYAKAKGISVMVPEQSTLLKGPFYPVESFATPTEYVGGLRAIILDPDQLVPRGTPEQILEATRQ